MAGAGNDTAEGVASNPGGKTEEWEKLREGKAEVLHARGEAFYNPAQVQNRDLSVAVLREFHALRERERTEAAAKGFVPFTCNRLSSSCTFIPILSCATHNIVLLH